MNKALLNAFRWYRIWFNALEVEIRQFYKCCSNLLYPAFLKIINLSFMLSKILKVTNFSLIVSHTNTIDLSFGNTTMKHLKTFVIKIMGSSRRHSIASTKNTLWLIFSVKYFFLKQVKSVYIVSKETHFYAAKNFWFNLSIYAPSVR